MNYSEEKKRKVLVKRNITTTQNDVAQRISELEEVKADIKKTYDSIKDFTVDYITAKEGKARLQTLGAKKKSLEKGNVKSAEKIESLKDELTKLENNG